MVGLLGAKQENMELGGAFVVIFKNKLLGGGGGGGGAMDVQPAILRDSVCGFEPDILR